MSKKATEERKKIKAESKSKAAEVMAGDEAMLEARLQEAFEEARIQIAELEDAAAKNKEDNTKLVDQVEDLKNEKSDLEKSKTELESQLSELQTQIEAKVAEVEELQKKIEDMERQASMQARIAELEELDLASDKRVERIKDMTDEQFAAYKDDLVELLETVKKDEAAKSKEDDTGKTKKSPKKKDKEADAEESEELDELEDETAGEESETDETEGGETKLTAAKLLELRRAAAAYNKATSGGDVDESGVDLKLKNQFAQLWAEEEDK